jgi:cytochrome c-type biogenesis protein CcmH
MMLFWALGGALALLALALVLRPLLARGVARPVSRREANLAIYRGQLRELDADLAAGTLAQADYKRAREELEARALEDLDSEAEPAPVRGARATAALVALGLPAAALAVYLAVGSPGALAPQVDHGAVSAEQIEVMVGRLEARMRENPGDAEGWALLGRSYAMLGRFGEAADAYAEAVAREPRDAALLADFADALAMARGQSLQGEPEKLVLRALEIDPRNLKALALAGTAAFERGAFDLAVDWWQKMLPLVPADSEEARAIRGDLAEAKKRAGTAVIAAATGLRGTVRISPQLKGQFGPEDTVFIYARAAEGPRMPLAVLRRQARELPAEFALDDSMAMAPGMTLSAHPRIVVTARVSKSGGATPQAGDLQGASEPVPNDASGVDVTIDAVVR